MNRTPVNSSHVKSVGHHFESSTLEVEFNNGAIHQYHNVPQSIYTQIVSSASVGKTFHDTIRSKPFRSTQIR